MVRRGFVVFTFVVAMLGCEKKAPPARAVVVPTAAEAESIGRQFAASLTPCDAAALDRVVDMDLMIKRAVAGREFNTAERDGIRRGAGSIGSRLCQQLQGATATYLRTPTIDNVPRPLIRILQDGGFNYYQLELDKQSSAVRIADLYIFAAGEKMSETLGHGLDALKASGLDSATQVTAITQLAQAGDFSGAHVKLLELPAPLRGSKSMLMMEIMITSELEQGLYVAAMDRFAREFPNDPALLLLQLDNMQIHKQYADALAVADKIDKQVGGDPFLASIRVDPLAGLGRYAEAIDGLKKAIAQEPTLEQLYWALLTAQSDAEKFADAVKTLDEMRAALKSDITVDTIAGDERFAKLAESAELKAWVAKQ